MNAISFLSSFRCQIKARWQQRNLQSSWVSPCFCLKSGMWTQRHCFKGTFSLSAQTRRQPTSLLLFSSVGCCWLRRWVICVETTLWRVWDFTQTSSDRPPVTLEKMTLMYFLKELKLGLYVPGERLDPLNLFPTLYCTICCCSIDHPSCLVCYYISYATL